MATVSVAFLTWNRASVLKRTMEITLNNAGVAWDEFVWTDNGSEPDQYAEMDACLAQFNVTTKIRHSKNTGMPRGFNSSFAACRSDYVVMLAPDIIMPDNWLRTFMEYMALIEDAGIVALYTVPIDTVPERYRKNRSVEMINGLPVLRAMPFDQFIFRRSLLQKIGYWREDFGLYGWSDVEWIERCEKWLPPMGLNCYVIPNATCTHMGSEGAYEFKQGMDADTPEYHAWKQQQSKLASNRELIQKCHREGYPIYFP